VPYSENFEKAFCLAAELHRDQLRKGTSVPYVNHLMAVAAIVGESGGTEDEVIAALLHDAMEDTDATYDTLAERFGKPMADIVQACSDTDVKPKPAWEKWKKDYIAHIVGASEPVRLVSAADKLANARSVLADLRVLGDAVWCRFNGGKEGTLWYYRSLASVFGIAGSSPSSEGPDRTNAIVEELDRVVTQIERLAGRVGPSPASRRRDANLGP
jgi:GTP pyrophosphokinase